MSLEIVKAKSKLPLEFINNLYNDFSERVADKILQGMLDNRFTSLRVNTLKSNNVEVVDAFIKNGIEFENVHFYEDAYIITSCDERKIQELEIYNKGKIYLQSLSSMVPPFVLNPKEGEKVLDMTAAPRKQNNANVCHDEKYRRNCCK